MRTILIDVAGGRAQVYREGQSLGTTPCELKSPLGAPVRLVLKREGFNDKQVEFSVTENKKVYTLQMTKEE